MTTVLDLDDELIRQAKDEAARRGTSLNEFVEQTLREKVRAKSDGGPQGQTRLPTHDLGGLKRNVNFDNGRAVRDLMDDNGLARC